MISRGFANNKIFDAGKECAQVMQNHPANDCGVRRQTYGKSNPEAARSGSSACGAVPDGLEQPCT